MGALAPSRLGNKNFIDDSDFDYSNFSIVSKREKRRRKEASVAGINAEYSIDPKYENDCDYLTMRLQILQDDLNDQMSRNPSKVTTDRVINPMKDWESKYKRALTINNCLEVKKKRETEQSKKETIDILTKTTETPPPTQLESEVKGSKTTTYIIYGVGGVITLVALILLLKKSN